MKPFISKVLLAASFLGLLLMSGCLSFLERPAPEAGDPLFVPPTLMPSAIPTAAATSTPEGGSNQLDCANNLLFLDDLTVPDGTIFAPGDKIDKQWQVENNGTCNWNENYRLRLVAGDALGAEKEQSLFPARAGSQAVIRIEFIAPMETGSHRSAWQAFGPDGRPFGDPFYLEIMVARP